HPSDLLQLARCTKPLRAMLTSRDARPIWRQTLSNVTPTMPPCPPDLNEMQYANLAFSTHCHECCSHTRDEILWAFRVRLCENCAAKLYVLLQWCIIVTFLRG
ncbi:hypothetical protein PLICRDRAFT_113612, partial [Plicaturopsis crispa FD-325 SS-3]